MDGLPDPPDEMLRRFGVTFVLDDRLELFLEFGPIEARGTRAEMVREAGSLAGIELPVKEVLDLRQNLFTANLGQGHAPVPRPITASRALFFPDGAETSRSRS